MLQLKQSKSMSMIFFVRAAHLCSAKASRSKDPNLQRTFASSNRTVLLGQVGRPKTRKKCFTVATAVLIVLIHLSFQIWRPRCRFMHGPNPNLSRDPGLVPDWVCSGSGEGVQTGQIGQPAGAAQEACVGYKSAVYQ